MLFPSFRIYPELQGGDVRKRGECTYQVTRFQVTIKAGEVAEFIRSDCRQTGDHIDDTHHNQLIADNRDSYRMSGQEGEIDGEFMISLQIDFWTQQRRGFGHTMAHYQPRVQGPLDGVRSWIVHALDALKQQPDLTLEHVQPWQQELDELDKQVGLMCAREMVLEERLEALRKTESAAVNQIGRALAALASDTARRLGTEQIAG